MKNIVMKRFLAYVIDIFLVTFIAFIIIQIPVINPYLDRYEKKYNEYIEIQEKYENKKISEKEYNKESRNLSYTLDKYNFPYTVVTTACLFGYFILFQYYNNGQTLGKKLLKLRVKGYNDKKIGFKNYLIRSLLLNNIIINILMLLCLLITDKSIYYYSTYVISIIQIIFMYANIIVLLFRKDNRGLHDVVSGTLVIEE